LTLKNISKLYFEILEDRQKDIFFKLQIFSKRGVLGGGTALALQLKHRKSYDFDIFTKTQIPHNFLLEVQKVFGKKIKLLINSGDELTFLIPEQIKITFIYFPFPALYKTISTSSISIFSWKDIILDKAYALGRRGEYRDYVDIFFVLKKGYELKKIIHNCQKKFGGLFSEKLFLEQLIYFEDIKDFSVEFIGERYQAKEIKAFLKQKVKDYIKI
jgi:predicted nucleotidyltransferase component of viral defense system